MLQEPDSEKVAQWLKGNFRQALREYFTDELNQLWCDFVGDVPELHKKCDGGEMLPDADLTMEVGERKEAVEKVLAFKPIADEFLGQEFEAIENYVTGHADYLKGLLDDKIGSGIGQSRADIVLQMADEISIDPDGPPALLVALYIVKQGKRLEVQG